MTVAEMIEKLRALPPHAKVFMGRYEHVADDGLEIWGLYDFVAYFRHRLRSCRSSYPASNSISGPYLVICDENQIPAKDDPIWQTP